MSKYEKTTNYQMDLSSPLVEGETLIWSSKPKKTAFIMNKILMMMPIALIWLAFDSFFISLIIKSGQIKQMLFFVIPFFILHLMPVWIWLGNIITASKKWQNTKYYVTDKRIILQSGFVDMNYQTIYYKDIKNVNLRIGLIDKILGVGDIYFDLGSYVSNGKNGTISYAFLDIEKPHEIYPRLQKIVLDIQTDIEYPNALRPNENFGYKTKYRE